MTAEASVPAPDSVQYHEQRIGIIVKAKIEAKFGDSAEVKQRIAQRLGLKSTTTLYARFHGAPGFSIGELMVLADLLDDSVEGICNSDVLPPGSTLPFRRRARRNNAPLVTLSDTQRPVSRRTSAKRRNSVYNVSPLGIVAA